MNPNPYESQVAESVISGQDDIDPRVPFWTLVGIFTVTLLLAWIAAIQEGVPGVSFIAGVLVGSVAAQCPGLICGFLHGEKKSRTTTILLVPAFVVAVISLLIYVLYVLSGTIQTTENAGQMHVIFIPILLGIFSFALYTLAFIVIGIVAALNRN